MSASSNINPLVDTSLLTTAHAEQRAVGTAHRLYEHLIALWAPGVIEAAHDLGVFATLARGSRTSADLAADLNTDPRTTRILLDALYAYDFLERVKDEDGCFRYVLPDDMQASVLPGGMFSLAGKIVYDRNVAWNAWRNLAEAVRSGARNSDGATQLNQISQADYRSLVGGINFWAPPIVEILIAGLRERGWLDDEPRRLLDVGCGTGIYSQLLLRHFRSWQATGLDTETITPLAAQQSAELGVDSRFTPWACDFWKDSWGDDFDLIVFANIFHLQTADSAESLVVSAAKAMASDGLVAVVDHIVDADRNAVTAQDRFALLFAASMTTTGGGDAYTLQDYDGWFARAGLRRVSVLKTPMHRILLAERA